MRRGLISETDAKTIEKTLQLVLKEFPYHVIKTCEVGILDGSTSLGIHEFFEEHKREHVHTAIDNAQYCEIKSPFDGCNFILGDSKYVYNHLEDSSQNFIFVDANHNYPSVIADFYCYSRKVRVDGFIGFHDTALHIKEYLDYQWFGDKHDTEMYISVRKALTDIGLYDDHPKWKLIFDECDQFDAAGGVSIFQRIR